MVKRIFVLIIALAYLFGIVYLAGSNSTLCDSDYISIELKYTSGNFSVLNKSLEQGCSPNYMHKAGFRYSYELEGNNKSLYEADFTPVLFSDSEENGSVEDREQNLIISVPSKKEGEKVNIYDESKKIMEINVYDVGATSCRI